MKKIIAIAAIAFSAMCAHAAATSWQFTAGNLYDHTGETLFTGAIEVYASGGGLTSDLLMGTLSGKSTYSKAAIDVASGLSGDVTYDIYFVMKDGDYTYTSATKSIMAVETGAASINFGNMKTATQAASNWAAAPEPTSGLLLLLGVAGLALKRKRA